jgi:hypothetical protein
MQLQRKLYAINMKRICYFCNYEFNRKYSLHRHLKENRCESFKNMNAFDIHKFIENNITKDIKKDTKSINLISNEFVDIYIKSEFENKFNLNKLSEIITKILEKICKPNNYKYKKYIFPSGKIVNYQGYENFALDELIKIHCENDIENDRHRIPTIKYIMRNKVYNYYPDIYIKSQNLIIEVKSDFTYKKQIVKNALKSLAVKKSGFNFEFWIYDKDKNKTIV